MPGRIRKKIITCSAEETIQFGAELAKYLKPSDIICLFGDLGTGKTTFVKGLAQGLRISQDKVHSPTFVLMNMYEGKLPLYHFDFYRLEKPDEIALIGYDEFLYGEGISVIEWSERLGELMPEECLKIKLTHKGEEKRQMVLTVNGDKHKKVIDKI